ncbi:unnamed protein product [Candidula unifasciata]|uniref:Neurotransmitter-gated ion-channel ligand-binding domain-containing protein n=1 Tax=Candidula unifasciata TaxID=100452 RepID=A0A8S3Z440_9EUPU|nr:unnamed protein product [Candidula unifasciata]
MLVLASLLLLQAVALTNAVKLKHSAIISYLRDISDPDVIPIPDTSNDPLAVSIDLWFSKILEVDTDRNEIEAVIWQSVSWRNLALAWDTTRDGFNESSVSLPTQYLWLPDITIYNAVSSSEVLSPSIANVANNGQVIFVPNIRVRVSCDLKEVDSHSGATCMLKFGSWTFSNKVVTISNPGAGIEMAEYAPNPNYEILATLSQKQVRTYTFGAYEDIEFLFVIRSVVQAEAVPLEKKRAGL